VKPQPAFLCAAAVLLAAQATPPVWASPQIAVKAGCANCHTVDKKLVGPSYKEIAARYKGKPDALAKLTQRVRKGGPGTWGPIPMPASDSGRISDADLKTVITWMLATPG
jgi:cytochrome c